MEKSQSSIATNLFKDLQAELVFYTSEEDVVTEAIYQIFSDRVSLRHRERNIQVIVQQRYYKNVDKDVHDTDLFTVEHGVDLEEAITNYYFNS